MFSRPGFLFQVHCFGLPCVFCLYLPILLFLFFIFRWRAVLLSSLSASKGSQSDPNAIPLDQAGYTAGEWPELDRNPSTKLDGSPRGRELRTHHCLNCGELGHRQDGGKCPHPCSNCGKKGHVAMFCIPVTKEFPSYRDAKMGDPCRGTGCAARGNFSRGIPKPEWYPPHTKVRSPRSRVSVRSRAGALAS